MLCGKPPGEAGIRGEHLGVGDSGRAVEEPCAGSGPAVCRPVGRTVLLLLGFSLAL